MKEKSMKTRFSPSPSGSLHVGGARSALYNWLLAKKHQGIFLVRVEDTDQDRSTPESEKAILDSLRWLELDWQEGIGIDNKTPYRQSERTHIYKHYAEKLVSEGKAYYCCCHPEDLDKQRKALQEENPKAKFKYPRTCATKNHPASNDCVVRFNAPLDGYIEYDDIVFGKVRTPNIENQDVILMRSDGQAMYNFSATIDDRLMEITHIVRGREHMVNSPIQLMLYQAFGWEPPRMAHLPLVLSQSGAKLSKRDGAAGVFEFRDMGFTPTGLLNVLLRLGFGYGDQEIFSRAEMIERFSLENCVRKDGKFDPVKAKVINFEHLKSPTLTPTPDYANHLFPFIQQRGLQTCPKRLESLIPLVRTRSKNFVEAANELDPILRSTITIDPQAAEKILTPTARTNLAAYNQFLKTLQTWDEEVLRAKTNEWLTSQNLTIKDIGAPVRLALYGRTQSPELFQVMAALGKDTTIARIGNCLVC
jgi:glutamyl-tRNA synthetase